MASFFIENKKKVVPPKFQELKFFRWKTVKKGKLGVNRN